MYLLIGIPVLVFLGGFIYLKIIENGDCFFPAFLFGMISVPVVLVLQLIIGTIFFTYHDCRTVKIASCMRESVTNGTFFLGTGSIDGKTYYVSYEEIGKKTYKLAKYPTDNSIIVENSNIEPNVYIDTYMFGKEPWIFEQCISVDYRITVPEGAVISQYRLE